MGENYVGVTQLLKHLTLKQNKFGGGKLILPLSFVGLTSYIPKHFKDALAIYFRLGPPDFFIIVTCNPDWPEFKEAASTKINEDSLTYRTVPQYRPDFIARIAKHKFVNTKNKKNNREFLKTVGTNENKYFGPMSKGHPQQYK